MYQVIKDKKYT